MSAILLAIIGWDPKGWDQIFRTLAPQRDIRLWPENAGNPADVAYACVWKPPHGMLAEYRNLKAVFSLGAGVDEILADLQLPNVPIVRIVDVDLTMRMTEYVVLHVLTYHRQQRTYDSQQRVRMWHDHEQAPASEVSVGVMGLGELGQASAVALQRLGFRVHGWSRTQKIIPGVETFYGTVGLEPFLRRTEILVCLLPSTPATRGILNLDTVPAAEVQRRHARRLSDQRRARRLAGRCRCHRRARGRHAGGRDARRVPDRAAAGHQPAVDARRR